MQLLPALSVDGAAGDSVYSLMPTCPEFLSKKLQEAPTHSTNLDPDWSCIKGRTGDAVLSVICFDYTKSGMFLW